MEKSYWPTLLYLTVLSTSSQRNLKFVSSLMISKSTKVNSCPSITSSVRLRLHNDTFKKHLCFQLSIVNK